MVNAADFVEKVKIPLAEGWGYIYGTWGSVWTQERQDMATREQTVKWGARWIGKTVTDCSGLVRWALYQLGEKIVHHARYQYTDWCAAKGRLTDGRRDDGREIRPGTLVFLQGAEEHIHHVGVYIGEGVCIEAKGTLYGVVTSPLSRWDHWGECKLIDYTNGQTEKKAQPAARKTAKVNNPGAWLNMRTGPGTSYPVLARISRGATVQIVDDSREDFWQILYGGRYGWAASEYLSVIREDGEQDEPEKDGRDADITDREDVLTSLYTVRSMIDEIIVRMGGGVP
jgi:cell wall-associated NlpC family hydrolase